MRTIEKRSCLSSTIKAKSPWARQQGGAPFFQPKLTVNTPGDAYEQEADQVADQVMRMQEGDAPIVQRMPLTSVGDVQRKCAACEQEEARRKETGSDSAGGKAAPGIVSDVLSSSAGRPMEGDTRQFMESRFGQDFSQVRIHTDSRAAESASAIQARAYTSGRDIVFGQGQYQPESSSGKRLLAHELAHVGQQGRGIKRYTKTGFSATQECKIDLAVSNAIAKIDACDLSRLSKRLIKSKLRKAKYIYVKDLGLCGKTFPFSNKIKLSDDSFDTATCCDLESTLAHEAAHAGALKFEGGARKLECKCFGCSC